MLWKPSSSAIISIPSVLGAASLTLALCANTASADLLQSFRSADAPLSGQLWDLRADSFVDSTTFLNELEPGSWLLLGETHENVDHHNIQALFINQLAQQSRMGTLALEMANIDQQPLLDAAQKDPTSATPEQLEWHRSWPWEWYEAPVRTGLEQASRVVGADLTRDSKMTAYGDDNLEVPAEPDYSEYMLDLLHESHCGQMPKSQLGNMLRVQYVRDISMRDAMLANTDPAGVNLLLAGTVHTRYDIGIPYWSEELNSKTVLMVAATENSDPTSYYPESYSDEPVADYILFTPPTEYESGCG